jgi:MFS family permease
MSFTSRWTDVSLAAAARAISTCGDFLAATALVLALQERGAGSGAVAAVLIAAAVPPVVLARWTGRLADRVDSRLLLVVTGLAQAAVCLALAYVGGTAAIVALVAALGCGLAVTQPTLSALVPSMVRREDLGRASALVQTATSVGLLVAPALGGILVGHFGLRIPLLADAASYLAITAAALLIRTRRGGRSTAADPGTPAPRFRLRTDTLLWTAVLAIGVVVAAVSAVNVGEVFLVRGELHSTATVYGLLNAIWLGALMIGGWLLTRRATEDGRIAILLLSALTITGLAVVGAAVVPSVGWLVPLWIIGGAANGAENVSAAMLIARRVPETFRGGAYATYGAVTNAANVTGYLIAGAVLALIPVRLVIGAAGVLGLLAAAACALPMLRAVTRERSQELPDARRATQATA